MDFLVVFSVLFFYIGSVSTHCFKKIATQLFLLQSETFNSLQAANKLLQLRDAEFSLYSHNVIDYSRQEKPGLPNSPPQPYLANTLIWGLCGSSVGTDPHTVMPSLGCPKEQSAGVL